MDKLELPGPQTTNNLKQEIQEVSEKIKNFFTYTYIHILFNQQPNTTASINQSINSQLFCG